MPLKTFLPKNINSRKQAEEFLREIYNNRETFDPMIPPHFWEDRYGQRLTPRECFTMTVLIMQIQYYIKDIPMFFLKMQSAEEATEYDEAERLEHTTPEMEISEVYEGREVKFTGFYVFEELIILN